MAGLYFHIPFCTQKCIYCDFFSGTNIGLKKRYIDAMCQEMLRYGEFFDAEPLRTIYFGGGTPSLLHPDELATILNHAGKLWDTSAVDEITLEANPDDLSVDYLLGLRQIGINRLSIGVQSLSDADLQWMRRRHNARQALDAIANAKKSGFTNISVDLIFGLPNQQSCHIQHYVDTMRSFDVEHISAYSLTVESRVLQRKIDSGAVTLPSDDHCAALFETVSQSLRNAGYHQYEISNYAKPGYESKHNSGYWTQTPYLGIGAGAYSFDGKTRWTNAPHTARYIDQTNAGIDVRTVEPLSDTDLHNEYLFTSLRRCQGIDLHEYSARYGTAKYNRLIADAQRFIDTNHLVIDNNHLALTHKGIYISDMVMSHLMTIDE